MFTSHQTPKLGGSNRGNHTHRSVQPTENVPKCIQRPGKSLWRVYHESQARCTPHIVNTSHNVPRAPTSQSQRDTSKIDWSNSVLKLDANSGFWQIPLAKSSRFLTTFITPSGRYYFNKLLFELLVCLSISKSGWQQFLVVWMELYAKWMMHWCLGATRDNLMID